MPLTIRLLSGHHAFVQAVAAKQKLWFCLLFSGIPRTSKRKCFFAATPSGGTDACVRRAPLFASDIPVRHPSVRPDSYHQLGKSSRKFHTKNPRLKSGDQIPLVIVDGLDPLCRRGVHQPLHLCILVLCWLLLHRVSPLL